LGPLRRSLVAVGVVAEPTLRPKDVVT
jgi:hypothetical protein